MSHADLPSVTLTGPNGGSAVVYLHGAHVTSWKDTSGEELLFVSKNAIFKPPKAIRGGVPVCFPQFGVLGPLSQHGFARNSTFTVASKSADTVALQYEPSKEDLAKFPHPFRLTVTVHVGRNSLYQEIEVNNTGSSPFEFTAALHTYFQISAIEEVKVRGLSGLQYFDNTDGVDDKPETGETVTINGEVDRIYRSADNTIVIEDAGNDQKVTIEKRAFPDAVLWNPWSTKAKGMSDFGDEEYKRMICLEPALAKSGPKSLEVGGSWSASQTLTVAKM